MATQKYIASRLNGDGTETFLDLDVPISDVIIKRDLSGPSQLTGTISPEISRLQVVTSGPEDNYVRTSPLFIPWSTVIYPELDGVIRHAFIVVDLVEAGSTISLDCVGFAHYPNDMPYVGVEKNHVQVDALVIYRELWGHLQSQEGGNLGISFTGANLSGIKFGTESELVEFGDVSFEAGPFKINYWSTHNIGKVMEDLARQTPFDYREKHYWDPNDDRKIIHEIELGYPSLGRRRHDLRFTVGENLFINPTISYDGEEYASEVYVLGSGEGRNMIRSDPASRSLGRLRRAAVVVRKDCRSKKSANLIAANELKLRLGGANIAEVYVKDHPHASLGDFDLGDEISVGATNGWSDGKNMWVRITAILSDPNTDTAILSVVKVER